MFERQEPTPAPISLFSEAQLASLKKRAKRIKKENPTVSHHRALDIVAVEHGYNNWKALLKGNSVESACQKLFNDGIAVVFDIKDYLEFERSAEDLNWWQMSWPYNEWLTYWLHQESLKQIASEPNDIEEPDTLDEFKEYSQYIAVIPSASINSTQEHEYFVRQCMEHSFFAPDYIAVQGEVYSMFGSPRTKQQKLLKELIGLKELV